MRKKPSVKLPTIEKLLKLNECFRDPSKERCTLKSIKAKCRADPSVGEISGSTIYEYVKIFRDEFGAVFKGKEIKRKNGETTFSFKRYGRETCLQYKDPNAPLPRLQELIGKLHKDSGTALLKLLEEETNASMAAPVHIWLRMFLEQMLNEESKQQLDTVCFYENLDLIEENRKKFEIILKSILDKQPIQIRHKYGKRREVKIHPYLLKNYNQRWYLIGKRFNDDKRPGHLENYYEGYATIALNAIEDKLTEDGKTVPDIRPWKTSYREPDKEELQEYYDEIVGVTSSADGPQDVYLRFDRNRYEKYVATKPIVRSQNNRPESPNSKYYDPERPTVRLKVHITKELVQQILSFGPDCEVIAPESLRNEVAELYRKTQEMYNY